MSIVRAKGEWFVALGQRPELPSFCCTVLNFPSLDYAFLDVASTSDGPFRQSVSSGEEVSLAKELRLFIPIVGPAIKRRWGYAPGQPLVHFRWDSASPYDFHRGEIYQKLPPEERRRHADIESLVVGFG
ncbi:MAG TPA: hypothetical protein VJK52_01440 [Candidatus Nanoarchaeia archaeon]|nr:hypothetical protein [Candidatus Nanoarchaeia archaeon]